MHDPSQAIVWNEISVNISSFAKKELHIPPIFNQVFTNNAVTLQKFALHV